MSEDHIEIERAWILKELPPQELITYNIPHEIAYLFSDHRGELRIVRRYHYKDNGMPSDGTSHSITVKSGQAGLSRSEWEDDEFPEWAFNILWEKRKAVIRKTRYFVKHGRYRLEIDLYRSREYYPALGDYLCYSLDIGGKIRMECEFSSEEEANEFILPDWAEGAKEITGIAEYRNRILASEGWPV